MRVDNDWEEGIGKKLYDFEGELSPQDWANINQRLKPRRNYRYFWLPALLFFLVLPTALYFSDSLSWLNSEEQNLAQNSTDPVSENIKNEASKTVSVQGEKPEIKETVNSPAAAENGMVSGLKTHETITKDVAPISKGNSENIQTNSGNESGKNLLAGGLITTNRPSRNVAIMEKNERTEVESKERTSTGSQNIAARSGNQQAGTLAFHKVEEVHADKATKPNVSSEIQNAKTVGFSSEKLENTFVSVAAENNSDVKENAEILNANEAINANEIAGLELKTTAIAKAFSAIDFPKTLPDSLKKYLIATLPQPENQYENNDKKQDKNSASKWAFSVYGMPHYTFQRVLPNQQDNISILKLQNKNAFESERFGYEFGLRAYYQLRKNLQLNVGIQAARINQHLRLQTVNLQPDSVVTELQSNSVSMQLYHTQRQQEHLFRYYFGGIFTGLNLCLSEKLDMAGGVGMNWLLQTKSTREGTAIPTSAFNPYLNLSFQYKQPLSENLTLTAGPAMQYYLKPVQDKQAFVGVKPTTIGFSVGLKFKPF
ncbi:hypothetical protein [Adhaeribacter terreus]|uniref:Outer membrane protein beta-barrel domain-containing protein n=1 Tax=Adhaeribacter terreus TaxID=529703 RepID=A0ABW0EH19_9BACT